MSGRWSRRWSTVCAAMAALSLAGCSTVRDFQEWWTEDLSQPPREARRDRDDWRDGEDFYARGDVPPMAPRREAPIADETLSAPAARPDDIQESRLPPLREALRLPPRVRSAPITTPPASAPPASAPPSGAPRTSARALAPLPPQPPRPAPQPETAVLPEAPRDTPIVPDTLVTVAGMTEARVREALGVPTSTSQRASQKIWRYQGKGCAVEVVFFLDVTNNRYAALDHKTLGVSGPCLRAVPALPPQN